MKNASRKGDFLEEEAPTLDGDETTGQKRMRQHVSHLWLQCKGDVLGQEDCTIDRISESEQKLTGPERRSQLSLTSYLGNTLGQCCQISPLMEVNG